MGRHAGGAPQFAVVRRAKASKDCVWRVIRVANWSVWDRRALFLGGGEGAAAAERCTTSSH